MEIVSDHFRRKEDLFMKPIIRQNTSNHFLQNSWVILYILIPMAPMGHKGQYVNNQEEESDIS